MGIEDKKGKIVITKEPYVNEHGIKVVQAQVDDTALELTLDIAGAKNGAEMVEALLNTLKTGKPFAGVWSEKEGKFIPSRG